MLKIRSEHIDALASRQTEGFAGRMMAHLREMFSEEVAHLDDRKLRAFVDKVCSTAERWGIVQERHVERLIELHVAFDELRRNPVPTWVTEIVEYPDRQGEEILARLEENLLFGERG